MRAVFGVLSLLVVVAIVGMLASRQLKATRISGQALTGSTAEAAASTTVRQQSQQIQQKVADDVTRALQQGAPRSEQAEK
jgi:Tfp pilus assembly protein PilX